MIIQPGTIYEDHYVWLLKNGIDQTGEMSVSTGTWQYYDDSDGQYICQTADTNGGLVQFPAIYLTKRYMYIEVRSMINASNYSIHFKRDGNSPASGTDGYSSWYRSNGTTAGSTIAFNYTFIYGKRGTMRFGFNFRNRTTPDTTLFGIGKTYNRVRIYNIYMSDYTNDFISPSQVL